MGAVLVTRFVTYADEIQVSLDKLVSLKLIEIVTYPNLVALGKLFLAAVED
jgi:hypothetical protein